MSVCLLVYDVDMFLQLDDTDGCGTAEMTREQAGYGDMDEFIWGSEIMFEAHVIERGTSECYQYQNAMYDVT